MTTRMMMTIKQSKQQSNGTEGARNTNINPNLQLLRPFSNRTIDFSFFGAMTERREQFRIEYLDKETGSVITNEQESLLLPLLSATHHDVGQPHHDRVWQRTASTKARQLPSSLAELDYVYEVSLSESRLMDTYRNSKICLYVDITFGYDRQRW